MDIYGLLGTSSNQMMDGNPDGFSPVEAREGSGSSSLGVPGVKASVLGMAQRAEGTQYLWLIYC